MSLDEHYVNLNPGAVRLPEGIKGVSNVFIDTFTKDGQEAYDSFTKMGLTHKQTIDVMIEGVHYIRIEQPYTPPVEALDNYNNRHTSQRAAKELQKKFHKEHGKEPEKEESTVVAKYAGTAHPFARTMSSALKTLGFSFEERKQLKIIDVQELTRLVQDRYRELAKSYHPDIGGNEERFKEVGIAYDRFTNVLFPRHSIRSKDDAMHHR